MSENKQPELDEEIVLDFELIIGDAGGKIDNGDVPIRWCVTPEFVKKLEDKGVVDPHVLIASYAPMDVYGNENPAYYDEMDRRLVPLAEMMTFLRFTKAGEAKVYGVLLDGACGRSKLNEKYMRKEYDGYENIVDQYEDNLYKKIKYSVAKTSEMVEIPTNVFGKEPSPWVKWYVNMWHDSRSKITDECDFRKRFFIAFAFKWMAWIPYVIGRVLLRVGFATTVLGCGYFKKVNILHSLRPYKYPSMEYNVFDTPINVVGDNFFVFERKNLHGQDNTKTAMIFGLAFTPILIAIVTTLIWLLVNANGTTGFLFISGTTIAGIFAFLLFVDFWVAVVELMIRYKVGTKLLDAIEAFLVRLPRFSVDMGHVLIVMIGIVLLVAVGFAIKYILIFLGIIGLITIFMAGFFSVAVIFADKLSIWLDNHFALSAKNNDYGHLTELLCAKDEDNLRPNYNYIPKKQRTIRLWYHDLKNKVCKPMQD